MASDADVKEQEDGSVVVTLEVPINYGVTSWILGFGAAAMAIEPTSLRMTMEREPWDCLAAYHNLRSW